MKNETNEAKYAIWCTVCGGVTGHREAWFKDGSRNEGVIALFDSAEEAEDVAARLRAAVADHPTCTFTYEPRPFGAQEE